jgi:hypothetical protein
MTEDRKTKVLVDVEIEAKDALKNLAELKLWSGELKDVQKDLKEEQKAFQKEMNSLSTSTKEGANRYNELREKFKLSVEEYEAAGQEIKSLNKRAEEYQKEIQNNIKYEKEQEGSLQQLKAKLSLNTAAYNKLSEAECNSAKGSEMQKSIVETTEKLNDAEQSLLNFHRKVGNYAVVAKSLKQELTETTDKLFALATEGQKNSEQYAELAKRAIELKNAQETVNQTIGAGAKNTAGLDALNSSLSGLTSAYGAYASIIGVSAEGQKEFAESMKAMQVAMTALATITQLQVLTQKQSAATQTAWNILTKFGITQTVLQTKAEAALTVVKGKGSIATKAVAAAQWLWNAALAANPVLLILAGIAALIIGIVKLTGMFSASAKAQKEATKASEAYEIQQRNTAAAIEASNNKQANAVNARNNKLREEIIEMKKNGATAEQIAKAKAKAEQDIRDIEIAASKEREKQKRKEYQSSLKNIEAQKAYLSTLDKGSKKYKEQLKAVNDLIRAHNGLVQSIKNEQQSQIDNNLKSDEATQQAADQKKQKYQDEAQKLLDLQKKLQDEQNKLTESGLSSDFFARQEWNKKIFDQNQEHEQKKLDMLRSFGKLTQAEYDEQNKILAAQSDAFHAQQAKDLEAHYKQQRDNLFSIISKSADAQILDMEKKYADALKAFGEMPAPKQEKGESDDDFARRYKEYEQFEWDKANYRAELERQMAKDAEAIRAASLANILKDSEDALNKQYAGDLAKYTDNEREKNRIEIEMLEESAQNLDTMLRQKKISIDDYNRELDKNEAQLRTAKSQANQLALNAELLQAGENARAKYEARKAYLEKEKEAYKDNADKQKEIAAETAEVEKEYLQSRIAAFEEWAGRSMEIAGSVNELTGAIESRQLQDYEEDNEQKKDSLQQRLDSGKISQEQYDKDVAKLDEDLDQKKAEIARRQAIREKFLKVFDIGINTAAAIMKNTAQLGLPLAIPVNIATAVLGAVQLATVLATPLPKAARGKLIHGPSHAAGGTLIEAEGGEAIINKRSTALFAPLLSAINEAGGGIPFVRPLSDGGYAARNTRRNEITPDEIKKAMEDAISKLKVYTTIEDIRREDRNYSDIEARASY